MHYDSGMTDVAITDIQSINILICYLLHKIGRPVEKEQLYEIAIEAGVIGGLCYNDSIESLLQRGALEITSDEGAEYYSVTNKGKDCAQQLMGLVPWYHREKIVETSARYFARLRRERGLTVEYINSDSGCYVRVRCRDIQNGLDLIDLKLYAPDDVNAKLIGERIKQNPAGFYGKIMDYALSVDN